MIIDAHTHIGDFLNKKGLGIKDLIRSMNESKVDISVVFAGRFGVFKKEGDVSNGIDTKELIHATKDYEFLKVVGNVDYDRIDDGQILELKSLIHKKLIFGIKCYVGYQNYFPNDEKLKSLYDFCSRKKMPVIYHSGYLPSLSRGMLKFCHPLAIDEVAVNFPDLKIIIAHIGNPWIEDAAAVVEKNKNVYLDISGQFSEGEKISREEANLFIKRMKYLESLIGIRRIIFGSDWWFYSQKECLQVVKRLKMRKEDMDFLLWKNAKNVFNL